MWGGVPGTMAALAQINWSDLPNLALGSEVPIVWGADVSFPLQDPGVQGQAFRFCFWSMMLSTWQVFRTWLWLCFGCPHYVMYAGARSSLSPPRGFLEAPTVWIRAQGICSSQLNDSILLLFLPSSHTLLPAGAFPSELVTSNSMLCLVHIYLVVLLTARLLQ